MANQNNNQKVNGATEQVVTEPVQTQVNAEVPVQPAPAPVQQQVAPQQEGGFKTFCKKHWKGLVAGVTGIVGTAASAVVAYKRGKAAGIMSVPVPPMATDQEDYSLDPNRE